MIPKMHRPNLLIFVSWVRVVPPVGPECVATEGVDYDEEDKEDNVHDGDLLPVMLEVREHARLAGLAVVAEHALIVRPRIAVRVIGRIKAGWFDPNRLARIGEVACSGRFTAPGLYQNLR